MSRLSSLLLASSFFFSGSAFADTIVGSGHDFSSNAWSGGEICVVCHTPHNADTTMLDVPLWNHTTTTASGFTLYSSPTLDATPTQPAGSSLACLSCHDGTVAVDSYGGAVGSTFVSDINPDADLTKALSNDHPISFTYDTTLATTDGGLFDPSTTASGVTTAGTIADDMLFAGEMECASCHDPHDPANFPFLVKSNANSALCLTCHDK